MRPLEPQPDLFPEIDPDEVRARNPARSRNPARAEPRRGPGPSKLSYRLARAWAKPMVRGAVLVYLPLAALALAGWRVAAHDEWRGAIVAEAQELVEGFVSRPEFAVRGVYVIGGGPELKQEVHRVLAVRRGMSSLRLDIEALRRRIESLGAVERAAVRFDSEGTLRVAISERIPAVLFRRLDDVLVLVDRNGVEIGPAGPRAEHAELPLVLGRGAPAHVGEVLRLLASAPDLEPRLRAAVRVGERRWDLVLDRDMVLRLPEEDSHGALARIMALHYAEELLDRDLAVVDMRVPDRPALRMTPEAAETYQIRKAVSAIGGKET